MKILALDTATVTGWAFGFDGFVESGTHKFPLERGSSPGMRFLHFRHWLRDLLTRYVPGLIIYEQAHHRGGAATELCVGFTTRIMEEAARAGIEYKAIHSATLKKWATGKGNASKEVMMAVAEFRFTRHPTDDNEADALLLLAMGQEMYRYAGDGK